MPYVCTALLELAILLIDFDCYFPFQLKYNIASLVSPYISPYMYAAEMEEKPSKPNMGF